MEQDRTGGAPISRTPPYISYRTLGTVLEDLKTVGLPPRIDRSVLTRFSGGVGSQLLMGLKSLGLTDDDGVPTEALSGLVQAYGTPEFRNRLRVILHASYPFLEDLDLTNTTPSMFAEAFKNAIDAKEDVLRKCRTFYLHAAKDAGIELGARLEKGSHRMASGGNGRKKRKPQISEVVGEPTPRSVQTLPPAQSKELEYQLVDLMTEPDIDDEVKKSIWSLVQYLTARKAKRAAAPTAAPS